MMRIREIAIYGLCAFFPLTGAMAQEAEKVEPGLTLRLYDVGEPMATLVPLVDGQTPNIDEKRELIDFAGAVDFGGLKEYFIAECSGVIEVKQEGVHRFRLSSDDGSQLTINGKLLINHDGIHQAVPKDGEVKLGVGRHPFLIRYFQNGGGAELKLEWKVPGSEKFKTVPASAFYTISYTTRVVAPGKKRVIQPKSTIRPGSGSPLNSVHPQWKVSTIRPEGFNPQVGAMAFHPDGRLFVSTFKPNQSSGAGPLKFGDGKVWALSNVGGDPKNITVQEVAKGLFEPLGMLFVDGDLYVSQRVELTRLRDKDGDGLYETHEAIGSGWESSNYHHFHFGLVEKDGFMYSTLSTSITPGHRGVNGPNPAHRGTWVQTNLKTGEVKYLAGGFRTPNGIGLGPEGEMFQTDNQGSWQPASRLNHLQQGNFYGHYNCTENGGVPSLFSEKAPSPAAVYLPQNEIFNSPTQPVLIPEGLPFAGDMLVGELKMGGINRISLDKVNGQWQGCAYRFTQGFEGGVNRIVWGPDGSLYVGCIGATETWSWKGTTYGLQRLSFDAAAPQVFDIERVMATPDGFEIRFTKPVAKKDLEESTNFVFAQWTYKPTVEYGGGKVDVQNLETGECVASSDGRSVRVRVPGLKTGYVVKLTLGLESEAGDELLSTEAWYTLNEIPSAG